MLKIIIYARNVCIKDASCALELISRILEVSIIFSKSILGCEIFHLPTLTQRKW